MYSYRLGENAEIDDIESAPRRCIFGLRPCDVHSIDCMDAVFFQKGYVDSYYAARRESCLLVALACPGAGENCFCEAMGARPEPRADGGHPADGRRGELRRRREHGRGTRRA